MCKAPRWVLIARWIHPMGPVPVPIHGGCHPHGRLGCNREPMYRGEMDLHYMVAVGAEFRL